MIRQKARAGHTELFAAVDAKVSRAIPRARMVGRSHAMQRIEREALLAARLNANVLVTGERGVGKALLARFIHEHSDRSIHEFATINCAGLPDMLVESALFGHVRGSFAGGYRDKPGLVESVAGGTIFLNDVGNLSARMQTRLLWFLETGEYQRMGGVRVQVQPRTNLSVRVIASTTTNLTERMAAGLFREDLYRRLNAVAISVEPLRERREDIWALVDHFAGPFAESPDIPRVVRQALHRADWPGNVSELKDFVLREMLGRSAGPSASKRATPRKSVNS